MLSTLFLCNQKGHDLDVCLNRTPIFELWVVRYGYNNRHQHTHVFLMKLDYVLEIS